MNTEGEHFITLLFRGGPRSMLTLSLKATQGSVSKASPAPLQSGKLANAQAKTNSLVSLFCPCPSFVHMSGLTASLQKIKTGKGGTPKTDESSDMDNILARIRDIQLKGSQQGASNAKDNSKQVMDKLIADLKAQKGEPKQQLGIKGDSASEPITPATDPFDTLSPTDTKASITPHLDVSEMLRVKQELAAAKSVINRQEQELAESRNLKHTIDQAMGPASEPDFGNRAGMSDDAIHHLQGAFNATARPFTGRADSWHPHDDSRSDNSDALSAGGYNRGRGIWAGNGQPTYGGNPVQALPQQPNFMDNRNAQGAWPSTTGMQAGQGPMPASQRVFSGPTVPTYGFDGRLADDGSQFNPGGLRRATSQYNRPSSGYSNRQTPFGGFGAGLPPITTSPMTPMGFGGPLGYQPRPIGTPLSPTASEFTTSSLPSLNSGWPTVSYIVSNATNKLTTMQMSNGSSQTYVTPLEPMNYRRLLDKTVSCDWKYIVDKIVCSNDQQASIFLQQKLKVGTAEQKYEIVEAIVQQAYPLMINRFGNFLVQRCFEHGTPEQVIAIANAIHGNVLALSMDPFGCHVIQKAFDSVPENHKADMVRELLRRIPDTVIHRYACHVWQKLFELRWSGEPPQIMVKVNEALRNMWHEVALGETGSLVVQNIFENCVEEEKVRGRHAVAPEFC